MEKIRNAIAAFKEKVNHMPLCNEARIVDRKEFVLLLSGISTCRKTPGIPVHMGYEKLYHCTDEKEIQQVKRHLEEMFGVKDKDSLMEACYHIYSGCIEYEHFMTFWKNAPMFQLEELNPNGREGFLHCRQFAENFYPFVQEKGFYAWDINERIGLCRRAVACGMISEEEFWQITEPWVRQAQVFYDSYGEYAVSCLCGALYEIGRSDKSDLEGFFRINSNLLERLLEEGGVWQRNGWYVPKEREWADLFHSDQGCLITKKALDTEQIGYMYREEPIPDLPDSGWRFFAGNESEAYVNETDNTTVCSLNMVCNLEPEIMAFLYAEYGRRFGRHENGWEEE